MNKHAFVLLAGLIAVGFSSVVGARFVRAATIESVRHESGTLESTGRGEARVRFRLTKASHVSLELFDGRDLLVGRVESKSVLTAGDQALVWSGRDLKGRPVPSEAYRYRLVAKAVDGTIEQWDPADDLAGTRTQFVESRFDSKSMKLFFALRQPSRVRARIGIKNSGPLLRTLLDWVPRAGGEHVESWDGRDASGTQDYSGQTTVDVLVEAFALPVNTILVGPRPMEVILIQGWPRELRVSPTSPQFEMFDFARQSITTRRDFPLRLSFPADLARDERGRIIVSGPIPVSLSVDEERARQLLNERFEVVYFIDERMVFETESGFFPITWTWDPKDEVKGEHSIHVNLRGFDGHFGMASALVVWK